MSFKTSSVLVLNEDSRAAGLVTLSVGPAPRPKGLALTRRAFSAQFGEPVRNADNRLARYFARPKDPETGKPLVGLELTKAVFNEQVK